MNCCFCHYFLIGFFFRIYYISPRQQPVARTNFLELIGEKILDCVLAALGRNLDYLIHYKSNVDNLIPQVIYLLDAKDSIQNEVAAARRNVMEIHPHVQTWLTRSDGIIAEAEAEEFIKNNGHSKMTCCSGWCPNLISLYRVSKRAYKMRLEVEEIKGKGNFNGVGYHEPTQVVGTATSNTGYEAFESRMQTLTGVLEALKDPKINRIGVYGMGGVGKTMLAKEVVKQAQKDQLFDKYLFLVVSKDPVLKNIQREMAEQLDLKLEVESESVRGDQLCKRLKQEKKTLIIIDDIWKPLKLEDLGISFGDHQKGCKLLLTSRSRDLLSKYVDTPKQFQVGVLFENEARKLFENIVGDLAYVARVRVRVRVRDSAIFEKSGCGCGGTRQLKNIFIYIFNILLNIFFHIIQTYTKFNVSEM